MLSLTQPCTSGSPPASTDPLHRAGTELLVELARDRAEVVDLLALVDDHLRVDSNRLPLRGTRGSSHQPIDNRTLQSVA